MFLSVLKNANLALAFLLELAVLASLGYWGFHNGQGMPAKIALGIGAPALAVVVWALFGSPTGTWRLQGLPFLILQIIFFGSAVVALFLAERSTLGVIYALLTAVNIVLAYVWSQK